MTKSPKRAKVPAKSPDTPDHVQAQVRIKAALDAGVPQIYFNGFANALSTGDITTVLERNGQPVAILNMSFTVAKSMSVSLGGVVSALENISERDMLTTFDLERIFSVTEEKQ